MYFNYFVYIYLFFISYDMSKSVVNKKKKDGEFDDEGDSCVVEQTGERHDDVPIVERDPLAPVEKPEPAPQDEAEKRFVVNVKEMAAGEPVKKNTGAKARNKPKIEPSNIETRAAAKKTTNKTTDMTTPTETNKEVHRLGSHSVTTNFVTETKLHIDEIDIGQNIITESLMYNRSHPDFYTLAGRIATIRSTVTGPAAERPGRVYDATTTFDRWLFVGGARCAIAVPRPPTLVWNDPIALDVMDTNLLHDLIVGTTPKPRPIQEGLIRQMGCNVAMAAALAPSILEDLTRYDTSSIWAKAFMTYTVLSDFDFREEENHMAYRYVPPAADPLHLVDITPADGNIAASTLMFSTRLAAGDLVLHSRDLAAIDIYALRIMSIGPQCLGSLAENLEQHIAAAPDHVLFSVVTPQVDWIIVQVGDAALPAQQAITSAQFLASILKIASMCGSNDELVRGFVKACSITYGNMYELNTRYTTASLEMGRFSWNRPWGHNPLWRFLNREASRINSAQFTKDAVSLRSMTFDEVPRVMALIAVILSLGVSATFNHLNISGAALNSQGGRGAAGNTASRAVITQLLSQNNNRTEAIFDLMCGFSSQISNMVINRTCFWGSRWSDNFTSFIVADWGVARSWQARWRHYIPYMASPLSVSGLLTSYSHLWGISQPPISFNIHAEIKTEGPAHQYGWYIFRGSEEYERALTCGKPYVYVPYGAMVLNAALQDVQTVGIWPITYQSWTVLGGHAEKGEDIVDIARIPGYIAGIRTIEFGNIVTYDWETRSLLSPFVLAADMGAHWFSLKRRNTMTSDNAGVVPEGGLPAIETDLANFNLSDIITGSFTGMFDRDLDAAEKSVGKEGN